MNTFYNILTFNFSHTLPKKQFLKYNILPVCVILLSSIHDLFAVLFFPSILIILFIFSLLSLYRLNDTGVNIIVSFILILIFILLISAYFAINFPTSSYSIEWEEDAGSSLYKIAVYKRDLIIRIYYIYTSLFMLMLFILPSSKNKKENIIHKRNKFFKKLQYIYITYFIYPLFRCFKYKKHYKMSSKTFFYFWILIIISIILYFLITSFYTVSLLSLRDIISNFTGGEFEDKNLGFGIVMFLSLAINGMLFLLILLIIFVSSASHRLYDVLRIKKSYINSILIAYSITAAYILYYIYTSFIRDGFGNGYYYFIIFHEILLLILTLLPSKKTRIY